MKVTKYGNLYQITFLPMLFPINAFLVEEEEYFIAVDVGVKNFIPAFRKISQLVGKPIHMLLLTHAHGDHVNGVPAFRQAFPNATIGISKRDARLLNKDFTLTEKEGKEKIKGGFPKEKIPIDFTFVEQDSFGSLVVISSPGHTPGSVSFYDSNRRMLIAGDAFQERGGLAVSGDFRWRFPFPALATWDKKRAWSSAKKLAELKPKLVAVGHGNTLVEPMEKMREAIMREERKLYGKKDNNG
ncbi:MULTISPECIES: MBL fold metallo-hydrolase [Enterococcus]|uniref:MBL fold metallo-hydrolase n=1 Tax=Enterococcus TaxID=1350 RepID=UPI00065E3BA1|nr:MULTISPECIES: MBL fold metallo-hydrolase [Enterococcus]KAF1304960.1 hypothetical protein BAU16_00110 [Enterococcus sp. JM9B]